MLWLCHGQFMRISCGASRTVYSVIKELRWTCNYTPEVRTVSQRSQAQTCASKRIVKTVLRTRDSSNAAVKTCFQNFHTVVMSTTDPSRESFTHPADDATHDRQPSVNRFTLAARPLSGGNIKAVQLFLFLFHILFLIFPEDKLEPCSASPIWKQ